MRILGVDPGLRHTGWCLVDGAKVVDRGVIQPPGHGKIPIEEALQCALRGMAEIATQHPSVELVVVEQVAWYGRAKRITLPLSHVAGGIVGFWTGRGVPVHLLLAAQRKGKVPRGKTWSEHEKDAYQLAITVRDVLSATGDSAPKKPSAVAKRRISVAVPAHGGE